MSAVSTYGSSTNIAPSDYNALILESSNAGNELWKGVPLLKQPVVDPRPSTQRDDSRDHAYDFDLGRISQGDDLNSLYQIIPVYPGLAGGQAAGGVILSEWRDNIDIQTVDAFIRLIPSPSSTKVQGRIVEGISEREALRKSHPKVVERIEYLAGLEPDWDGYSAKAVSRAAVKKCLRLLNTIDRELFSEIGEPFVAPMADGGLELEWEMARKTEIMLAIQPDGKMVRYVLTRFDQGRAEDYEGVLSERSGINEMLSSVLS